jgi:hypothetical protein
VHNVRSELRRKYGIEFPPPQTRPPETQRPIMTNAGPRTVQQAIPSAVNPSLPPAGGPQIRYTETVTPLPVSALETKIVNPEAPEAIKPETVTPAPDPLLQQVLDKESKAAKSGSRLELLQRLDKAERVDAEKERKIQHLETVRNIGRNPRCYEHNCFIDHIGGPVWICRRGNHYCYLNCPVCNTMLTYDGTRFICAATS